MMKSILYSLALLLAATAALAWAGEGEPPRPLARWGFEHGTDEWHSHGRRP